MKKLAFALAFLGLGTVLFLVLWGEPVFSSTSVCSLCGQLLRRKEWKVPMTFVTLWKTEWEEPIPLSRLIRDAGLVHGHAWAFARGSGNGVQ